MKKEMKKTKNQTENKKQIITNILILILLFFLILYCIDIYLPYKEISKSSTENIIINEDVIDFSSLTLEQKIAQMIMVRGDKEDLDFIRLNIGGIFLDRQENSEDYSSLIKNYQETSKIKLFIATDLEGAWTPFHNPKQQQMFPKFSEIETSYRAEEIGFEEGELLREIGFNMNFAPVAEYSDNVYGGRAFSGSEEEIAEKVAAYINGLQKNVLGTCKHYPGNSMEKNLHDVTDEQEISKKDLYLFEVCLNNNISSIMVSHQIATGEISSQGKPSSASEEVISTINYSVLIISDEVNMKGLSDFYNDKKEMYINLINSGNNLILDFELNSENLYKLIKELKEEVENGNIDKEKIDESVKKILILKGYNLYTG